MTDKPESGLQVHEGPEDTGPEDTAPGTDAQAFGPEMAAGAEATESKDTTESISDLVVHYVEQDRQAQAEKLPDALKQALVEETVDKINTIAERTVEKGQMEIGEFVFDEVFQKDLSLASSRDPRKDESFSRICSHQRLRVNGNSLNNWVRAAAERWRLGLDMPHLTMSHYIALLGEKDLDQRRALALEADANGYSVRQLKKKIALRTKETGLDQTTKFVMRKAGNILALLGNHKAVELLSDQDQVSRVFTQPQRLKLLADIKQSLKDLKDHEQVVRGIHDMLVTIELETLTTLSDEDEEGSEEEDESDSYREQHGKTET